MKVTFIPIIIGGLGTVTKGLIKGLEDLEIKGREETIQIIAYSIIGGWKLTRYISRERRYREIL